MTLRVDYYRRLATLSHSGGRASGYGISEEGEGRVNGASAGGSSRRRDGCRAAGGGDGEGGATDGADPGGVGVGVLPDHDTGVPIFGSGRRDTGGEGGSVDEACGHNDRCQ